MTKVNPGDKYGRLTVMERDGSKNGFAMWRCQCDCGNIMVVRSISLTSGHTKSCGCYAKEYQAHQNARRTHGLKGTKLYNTWCNMKARCYNPNHDYYYVYGERGICVCNEWKNNFAAFAEWSMANGYQEGLTLDRIDNYKGYSPDNCRWTTWSIQNKNKRPRSEWKKQNRMTCH